MSQLFASGAQNIGVSASASVLPNDLYFACYMVERIARRLKQPNKYVVNMIGHDELAKKLDRKSVV